MKNQFTALAKFRPQMEFLALLVLVLYRLYLTADRDIAAVNAPHDEFWYVHKAFTGIWSGQYDEMSFVHSPVYVLWLEFLNTYGVPARLGIEIAWIGAVVFLAIAIRNFSGSRMAAVLLAAFLLLHPYTVFIFDRSLAETLLAATVAVWLAACLEIWTSRESGITTRQVVLAVACSVMFAVSCNLRKEGIALVGPLVVLAGAALIWRGVWRKGAGRGLPSVPLVLFAGPLLATLCLGIALSALNYFKWGTFAPYDLKNAGYVSAVAALSGIDTGRTALHVTISKQMLEKAYAVSPTFRELQPQLQGPVGRYWAEPNGEIGNGFFYWALRDAAAKTGWHSSAPFADGKYGAAADQIEAAFATGVLKERQSLPVSFIDRDVGKWLPLLPASFVKIVRLSVLPAQSDLVLPKENADPQQFDEYLRVVGRRSPLLGQGPDIGYLADDQVEQLIDLARIFGWGFVCALLLAGTWALFKLKVDQVVIAAGICLFFCLARVALFALLDASSWNGSQARYMLPLLPLFGSAGVLGLASLLDRTKGVLSVGFSRPVDRH